MMDAIIGGIMIVAGLGVILFGLFASLLSTYGDKIITPISIIGLVIGIPLMYFGAKRISSPKLNY